MVQNKHDLYQQLTTKALLETQKKIKFYMTMKCLLEKEKNSI